MNFNEIASIVIPKSRKKSLLALLGCLAFVLVSLWMWLSTEIYPSNRAIIPVVSVVGTAFFGFMGIYIFIKLFDRRPGLEVDAEGLIDHSSGVSVDRIPWSDIAGLEVAMISGQRFIVILLNDPENYLLRGGPLKRLANKASLGMTGSPVNLSANYLRISHDELHGILTDAFER